MRSNTTFRSRFVQRLVVNPPKAIRAAVERHQGHERGAAVIKSVRRRLKKANTVKAERKPLAPEMRETLRTAFKDEVEKLSAALRRDLSHWV